MRAFGLFFLLTVTCLHISFASSSIIAGVDQTAWDRVVNKYVTPAAQMGVPINFVFYPGIATDRDFDAYITALAHADLSAGLSRNESFALGINMYNAFAAKTLIDYACKYSEETRACVGPVYGLPDITVGGPIGADTGFKAKVHNFAGKNYSLNDIEGMMRPIPSGPLFSPPVHPYEDLRVHACLVCDGTSCPNLALSAFRAETIDADMDAAATNWMANPWKGLRIDTERNIVFFSKIMSWFKNEFDTQGGVVQAYWPHFPADAQAYFTKMAGKYQVDFMDYVWDANGPVPCSCVPDVTSGLGGNATCHTK